MDTTITGSRNGHSPLFMWYAIKKLGIEGLKKRALDCLETAEYALAQFQALGFAAWRNPSAITISFPEPSLALRQKWQIATENGNSHIICMPGITKKVIDQFMIDLKQDMCSEKAIAAGAPSC